jgi:hypothetical protein
LTQIGFLREVGVLEKDKTKRVIDGWRKKVFTRNFSSSMSLKKFNFLWIAAPVYG